ncbi:hypothetical protein DFJ63DRAFT_335416 [Scheffersomyces coipomensis]|uniref:uncharacterized protein n=1 Tax=Scheffersomyces coipomensis TaxID=1788519 RepID=UPI00315C64B3
MTALKYPKSPSFIANSNLEFNSSSDIDQNSDYLTPPPTSTNSPKSSSSSTTTNSKLLSPNHFQYYTNHLNKSQFNSILITCATNLIKILYKNEINEPDFKFFIIEILRRSKTSIQSLQLTCFYLFKLIQNKTQIHKYPILKDSKKLFLGMIILASKFNQDHNYSFRSWLKICGIKVEDLPTNLKILKEVEIKCLTLLNYELYINGLVYENWCNILIIFGYDFIKYQFITESETEIKHNDENGENQIIWELNQIIIKNKLQKWIKFFMNLNISNLNLIKINFSNYYLNQLNKKIFIKKSDDESIPSLFATISSSTTESTTSSSTSVSRKRGACGDEVIINESINHKKVRL